MSELNPTCVECTDTIVKEGEGCAKCSNSLCGNCCEFFQGMTLDPEDVKAVQA